MELKILNQNQKQEIINKLKNQFGIFKINVIFVKHGAEHLL
jgi:hypothetical protein